LADILIRHLKEKGKEHSALALLSNQWGFDEQLIPKALQTVGNLFPHYSRHDESHSRQILINVERLLGENFSLLTATDTWLLLEAAYWHDIGMVVTKNDIEGAFNLPAFKQYISSIKSQPGHELHRFATNFDPKNIVTCFSGADTPLDALDKFRELLSEWFRREHAKRSDHIVQAPWTSIGVSSPRTELIPARLFKVLGRICHMHGRPFSDLFAPDGLPFREAGLAQEDCHPRFVACLLRMGDLLDLDDNRFCPVMQRISGEDRPSLSKAHEDKHAGIRHLRIDRERIEVSAECETLDGYLETFKWFDWLKTEIQNQMANWQDIVPTRALGLLPTLGNITVRLSGETQLLKEGQRPQFTVDGIKAIELLQGSNIYTTRFACVRELLQNAIDATLLKIFLSEMRPHNPADWHNPLSENIVQKLKKLPVSVTLSESISQPDDEKTIWTLTISDNGTGISREDLAYMMSVGGSQRNIPRQSMINEMPEWMKPSGAFGIGFQSAFLISDEVSLISKSIFSGETIRITMHSPTGPKEGLVLVNHLENDLSQNYGTKIQINFMLDRFARSWSISSGDRSSLALEFLKSMDPNLDVSFPLDAAVISDQIRIFSENSPIPIEAKLLTAQKEYQVTENISQQKNWNFVPLPSGEQLAISYRPTPWHLMPPAALKVYFRGQPFEFNKINLPYVAVEANLLSGKAGNWLTADRDKVKPGSEENLRNAILQALQEQVSLDLSHKINCELLIDENVPSYSFFLEAMSSVHGGKWEHLAKELSGAWLDLPYRNHQNLRHFFAKDEFLVGEISSFGAPDPAQCDICVDHMGPANRLEILMNEWQKKAFKTVRVVHPSETSSLPFSSDGFAGHQLEMQLKDEAKFSLQYQFKSEPQALHSDLALASRLVGVTRMSLINTRFLLECQDEFSNLQLRNGTALDASLLFHLPRRGVNHILLPFLYREAEKGFGKRIECTDKQLEAISGWIKPKLAIDLPVDDIRKAYSDLIDHIDKKIMKPSQFWGDWKKLRGFNE
jgi:hypothetical protein